MSTPIRVEVAPEATLLDILTNAEVEWFDLSCRVRLDEGVSVQRGRTGQAEAASAGSCQFVLDNDDGVFTPGNGSLLAQYFDPDAVVPFGSPGPSLRDMPVRVVYEIPAGSSQDLWYGVITGVRVRWVGGMMSQAVVTAADAVAHLNRTKLRRLPLQGILARSPAVAYGLDEKDEPAYPATTSGATLRLQTVGSGWGEQDFEWGAGTAPGARVGDPEAGAATFLNTGAVQGWALDSGLHPMNELPSVCRVDPSLPGTRGTVHAMIAAAPPGREMTAVSFQTPDGRTVELGVTSTTQPFVRVAGTKVTGTTVAPGVWHHVCVTLVWDLLATAIRLYVDGALAATGSVSAAIVDLGAYRVRVGASVAPYVPQSWSGRVADVAAHDAILSDAVIAEIAAGRDGWTGDTTTDRGVRIARYALRAPGLPDMGDVGMSTMCPQHTLGRTAGQALDEVGKTEQSSWWTVRGGLLRVGSREARWGAPVAMTMPADTLDAGLEFEADNDDRVTELVVTRPCGESAVRRARQADDGLVYPAAVELLVDSDPQLESYADWAIQPERSEPPPRSETVSVDLVRSASVVNVAGVLATDIDDVIEISDLPASAPDPTLRLLVVGVSDRISSTGWLRTFNVAPADIYRIYWRLNVSALDTSTIPAP